jgi:hypothetical protein
VHAVDELQTTLSKPEFGLSWLTVHVGVALLGSVDVAIVPLELTVAQKDVEGHEIESLASKLLPRLESIHALGPPDGSVDVKTISPSPTAAQNDEAVHEIESMVKP